MANDIRQQRRAFWREAVEGWARSGLSKAAYAREHGLAAHQLSQWATRYPEWANRAQANGTAEDRDTASESTRFVTIATDPSLDEQGEAGSAIGVELDSGHRLEVRPGFCPHTLQRVVAVLSS